MRLILHIGMPKAGSTALQKGLNRLRPQLLERGYFYPKGRINTHNHSFLVTISGARSAVPSNIRAHYRRPGSDPETDLRDWLAEVRADVARLNPETLILSGEPFFKLADPIQSAALVKVLRDAFACEIEIVAYLRQPSEFYIASAQQGLKVSHKVKKFEPVTYRAPLESFAAVADAMHVFKYDRNEMPGRDVLRHFIETLCEGVIPPEALPVLEANVSLSAEALDLLARYRGAHHADRTGRMAPDIKLIRKALARADQEIPGNTRLRLRPDLAARIDQGSPDIVWLRERYEIVFEGVDYNQVAAMGGLSFDSLGEICQIDADQRIKTALQTFRILAQRGHKKGGGKST